MALTGWVKGRIGAFRVAMNGNLAENFYIKTYMESKAVSMDG